MIIVKPYAKIVDQYSLNHSPFTSHEGIKLLRFCEYAARISHRTEDKILENSYDRFLRFVVLEHGDFSVIEHASVSVEAVVDRGITHEWVRHRLGAYTQESTRFVNYEKKGEINFIISEKEGLNPNPSDRLDDYWRISDCLQNCEKVYLELIQNKVSPQIARSVLPNALASKILVTYNLRQWRLFFLMRTCKEAHPQMREVTIPLLKEFQEKIPIIYEDIIPESKQSDNLKKMR